MKKTLTIATLIAAVLLLPAGCANKKQIARAPQRTQVNRQKSNSERPAKKRDQEQAKRMEELRARQAEQQRIQDSIAAAEAQAEAELLLELARREEAERQRVKDSIEQAEAEKRAKVQSMVISRMTITISMQGQQLTTPATMRWQRGKGLVLSIQPMIGIELFRIETDAEAMTVIDKINRRYARMTYEELAQMGAATTLEETDAWIDRHILEQLNEPQLVLEATRAGIGGSAVIYTNAIQTNVNANIRPSNIGAYKQVSLQQFMGGML